MSLELLKPITDSFLNNLKEKLGREPRPSEVQDTANVRRRGKLAERERCTQLGNCSQDEIDSLDRDIAELQARKDQLDLADRQLADNREARGMARNADNNDSNDDNGEINIQDDYSTCFQRK